MYTQIAAIAALALTAGSVSAAAWVHGSELRPAPAEPEETSSEARTRQVPSATTSNGLRLSEGWQGNPVCTANDLELAPGGQHLLLVQAGYPGAEINPYFDETGVQVLGWPSTSASAPVWRLAADAVTARFLAADRLTVADEQQRQRIGFELTNGQWVRAGPEGRYAPSLIESVLVPVKLGADVPGAQSTSGLSGRGSQHVAVPPFGLAFEGPVARTIMPGGELVVHATEGRNLVARGDGAYSGFHAEFDPRINAAAYPDLAFASLADGTPAVHARGLLAVLRGAGFEINPEIPPYAQPVRIAGTSVILQMSGPDRIQNLSDDASNPRAKIDPAVITAWIRAGWHLVAASIDPQSGRSALLYRAFGQDDAVLELHEPADRSVRIAVCDRSAPNEDRVQLRSIRADRDDRVPSPRSPGHFSVAGSADRQIGMWLVGGHQTKREALIIRLRGGPRHSVLPTNSEGVHTQWTDRGFDLLLIDYAGTAGMSVSSTSRLAADVTGSLLEDAITIRSWLRDLQGYPNRQLVADSFGSFLASQLLGLGDTDIRQSYIYSGAASWKLRVDPSRSGQAGGERRARLYWNLITGAPDGTDPEAVRHFRDRMFGVSFQLCDQDRLTLLFGQHDEQIELTDWSVGCLARIPRIIFADAGHNLSATSADWLLRSLVGGSPAPPPAPLSTTGDASGQR